MTRVPESENPMCEVMHVNAGRDATIGKRSFAVKLLKQVVAVQKLQCLVVIGDGDYLIRELSPFVSCIHASVPGTLGLAPQGVSDHHSRHMLQIPFTSMVCLMVKWALASIPAFIILAALGWVVFIAAMAMFGTYLKH